MLADQLDCIVGVDPHRDSHALAVVHVISGAIVFEATVAANDEGYAQALELVDAHAAARRAVAGSGCSRSAGCAASGGRAERATHSMRSEPPGACSPRSGRRHRVPAVNA